MKLLNQKTTGICIKDAKKAIIQGAGVPRETRVNTCTNHTPVHAESRGTVGRRNAKLLWDEQPCKAKATAETKTKQGALYQRQAQSKFSSGAVFARTGLVEYGGHVFKLFIINCPKGPKLILYLIKHLCSERLRNGTLGAGAAAKEMKWQQKERGRGWG